MCKSTSYLSKGYMCAYIAIISHQIIANAHLRVYIADLSNDVTPSVRACLHDTSVHHLPHHCGFVSFFVRFGSPGVKPGLFGKPCALSCAKWLMFSQCRVSPMMLVAFFGANSVKIAEGYYFM